MSTSSSITLTFGVTCLTSTQFIVDNLTNIYLTAVEKECTQNCIITNTSFAIQCDHNEASVTIDGLNKDTIYNVSVVWISPQNSSKKCKILNDDMTTKIGKKGNI